MVDNRHPNQDWTGAVLARFFHYRWALPVIAELHRSRGAKFITLVNRLGVGRNTLSRTLKALAAQGLVIPNPGYGHPMRPEYILSQDGAAIGAGCAALIEALDRADALQVGLRKWSMPVVHALAPRECRFSELESALPGTTPRALTSTLKDLTEVCIVRRGLRDEYPPATIYGLTDRTTPMVEPLGAVAAELVART